MAMAVKRCLRLGGHTENTEKMFGSGTTTLIISNEEMNDIMKIVKSLEESGLLIKGVSKAIKNEAKNKKEDFSECY